MTDPFVKTWLAAYELDVCDVELLWSLVDRGDGMITADELMFSVTQLKGPAKSLDLHALMHDMQGMYEALGSIDQSLSKRRSGSAVRTAQLVKLASSRSMLPEEE